MQISFPLIALALAAFTEATPKVTKRSAGTSVSRSDSTQTAETKAALKACLTGWDPSKWHTTSFTCAGYVWSSDSKQYNSPQDCLTACAPSMAQAIDNNAIAMECNDWEGAWPTHCWMDMGKPSTED